MRIPIKERKVNSDFKPPLPYGHIETRKKNYGSKSRQKQKWRVL